MRLFREAARAGGGVVADAGLRLAGGVKRSGSNFEWEREFAEAREEDDDEEVDDNHDTTTTTTTVCLLSVLGWAGLGWAEGGRGARKERKR